MRWLILVIALSAFTWANAAQVGFTWLPVEYTRPVVYEVHWGDASRNYTQSSSTTETEIHVDGITPGVEQHYAVRACTEDRALCSEFSNEVAYTVPEVPPGAPQGFTIKIQITVEP